jgi:hypothetical protein
MPALSHFPVASLQSLGQPGMLQVAPMGNCFCSQLPFAAQNPAMQPIEPEHFFPRLSEMHLPSVLQVPSLQVPDN